MAEDKKTQDILKLFKKNEQALDSNKQRQNSAWRDIAILGFIILIWLAAMIYMNYFMSSKETAADDQAH